MVDMETKKEQQRSSWLSSSCFSKAPNNEDKRPRKPGGWKSMPFVIGNETCERLATFGLLANFMVYLRREFHLDQVDATNLINAFSGVANFAPLIGAFISDAYIGRFWAIAIGSVASFSGMVTLTLTAWIGALKPRPCSYNNQTGPLMVQQGGSCEKPNGLQIGILILSLGLLSIGTAGIRPCSLPFGVDQFDHTTEEGRRGINSYYNWYYATFTVVIMLALTVVVYIQDSVSWVVGLGIPTALMLCSIVIFFVGKRLYVYVSPEGSVFSSIFRVFVASYRKRKVVVSDDLKEDVLYDPPVSGVYDEKLPFTNQFRFLNKAAIIQEGELQKDGKQTQTSKWRLCTIQEIEQVKCIVRVLPIWASGIICFLAAAQQSTFTVSQAMIMNRHLGPNFQIPPGSITVISMLAVGIWIPIYDRIIVPYLRKMTRHEEGITLLQRMGIGLAMSILSMIVAGLVEHKRRNLAHVGHVMSIGWLAPQLIIMGLTEAFSFIGQIEFYNKQFPAKLSSLATSMFFCTIAGANYLSAVVVSMVHRVTGKNGHPSWLTNDLNQGRLDCFYYLLAMMGVVNLVYFILCARKYRYKGSVDVVEGKELTDIELNLNKLRRECNNFE